MRKSGASPSTSNRQAGQWVFRLGWMEELLQVVNHLFARVSVGPQESVVVPNGVQALPYLFLCQPSPLVLVGKVLDCSFLTPDVALHFSSRPPLGVDFFCSNGDQVVSEHIHSIVLFKDRIHSLDGLYA
jgi:hypothetical protein